MTTTSKTIVSQIGGVSMLCQEQAIEQFGPSDVLEHINDFDSWKWTIKAIGVLIRGCDMENFSGANQCNSDELRWGLQQVMEICVDHYEGQLNKLTEKAINSAECIIQDAMSASIGIGGRKRIQELLFKVEQVLSQFGPDEYPKAVKAREYLLTLLKDSSSATT